MSRLTKWNAESGQPVRLDVALQLKAELDEALARLEEENRELAQALIRCVRLLEVIPEEYVNSETGKPLTHSPDGALANANAVIAKLKNHRRGAGHE